MIHIYAELHSIDYDKLLAGVTEHKAARGVPFWLIKLLGELLTGPLSGVLRCFIPKRKLHDFVEEYGVSLNVLKVKGITLLEERVHSECLLKLSGNISKVDWDVLSKSLKSTANKEKTDSKSKLLPEIIKIIKPFIGETMATVPPSAVVALFELLGRDKLIEFAGNHGIMVSTISIKTG